MPEVAPLPLFKATAPKPVVRAPAPALASLPIDVHQVEKALNALLAFADKVAQERESGSDLLAGGEGDEKLFLVVGLKEGSPREVHMPVRLYVSSSSSSSSSPLLAFVS